MFYRGTMVVEGCIVGKRVFDAIEIKAELANSGQIEGSDYTRMGILTHHFPSLLY